MLKDELIKRFMVTNGEKFRLADFDPGDTVGLDIDKEEARELLAAGTGVCMPCRSASMPRGAGRC